MNLSVTGDNRYILVSEYEKPLHFPNFQTIAVPIEAIAAPQRIAILLAIGQGKACVCHLESAPGWRQAYISQHLMALWKADVLEDCREGRYVYYRLKNATYLDLITASAATVFELINTQTYSLCEWWMQRSLG